MKHIDAEKLIAEIERRKNESRELAQDHKNLSLGNAAQTMANEDEEILSIIDSLQQEQPEPLGYDKALLEVKSKVDEIYEKASIGLNEYDSGLYNGIAETCMKLRGFIKARLGSDEQPEADLDFQVFAKEMDAVFNLPKDVTENTEENPLNWEYAIARHFYELGKNARKEESK